MHWAITGFYFLMAHLLEYRKLSNFEKTDSIFLLATNVMPVTITYLSWF